MPTSVPPTTATGRPAGRRRPARPAGSDPATQGDPTAPLRDDSTGIDSALGTSSSGGPQLAAPVQQSATTTRYLDHHQFSADTEKDFYNFTESDYRHNEQFAKKADAKDAYSLLNDDFDTGIDGISENDRARIVAGVLDPAKLAAATKTPHRQRERPQALRPAGRGGDTKAVSTADDVLTHGEPGLQFFRWFYRAYHLYTGGGETIEELEKGYHAEQGMSFADYVGDAALLASIARASTTRPGRSTARRRGCSRAGRVRPPRTSGRRCRCSRPVPAPSSRTSRSSARTSARSSRAWSSVVIAKAEAVNQLFIAQLPDRIDGGIAYTFAKVATGRGEDPERRVILGLLGMDMTGRHEFWAGDAGNDWSSGDSLRRRQPQGRRAGGGGLVQRGPRAASTRHARTR